MPVTVLRAIHMSIIMHLIPNYPHLTNGATETQTGYIICSRSQSNENIHDDKLSFSPLQTTYIPMNIQQNKKKNKQTKSGNLNLSTKTGTKTALTGMECIQQQHPFSPTCTFNVSTIFSPILVNISTSL